MRKALYIAIGVPLTVGLSIISWVGVNWVIAAMVFFTIGGAVVSFYEREDGGGYENPEVYGL